jgi:hypothetical protein
MPARKTEPVRAAFARPEDPIPPGVGVLWRPHPGPQTEALLLEEDEICAGGAKGGGKTALGIAWLMKGNPHYDPDHQVPCDITYLNHRHYRALVLRKNVIDLGDWIDKARRIYEPFGGVFRERPSPLFEFRTGAKIVLGHLDDADTYTKYQGQEFQRFLLEEATLVPDLKSYLMVRSCIRSVHPEMHCQCLLTCNPGGPGHTWVRDRFIKPKDENGRFIPPNTRITDPLTGETRIFLPMKLRDNPALANDPSYVKKLMGLPEAERRAFLDGDWDALSGVYFTEFRPMGPLTGEPEEARHVIAAKPLKPWLNRLIGMDWGYAHDGAAYWGCEADDGRFHIYRELVRSKLGAEAWGVEIALASIEDLKGLEQGYMNLYLSPDAWEKRSDTRTIADQLATGIRRVLGPDSVVLTEEESGDEDLVERMRHQRRYGIMVKRAPNQRIAGAQYIRSALRWWPLTKVAKESFNNDLFLRLLRADPTRALEYREAFVSQQKEETLPGLLIHDCCPRIVEVLQNLIHSLNNPEDVEKRDGDDPYDGFRYLVFAHSKEKRREPFEEHFARRMAQVEAMHGGYLDGNTRVWAARKAEQDYRNETEAVGAPLYFPRAAGRRAKETYWRN